MFIWRWATQLGRTPRELLASTTSAEITEAMAYETLEPFGAIADEFRLGQIAATVANVNRDPERQREAWSAADFMPALRAVQERAKKPVLPLDAEQHAALLDRLLFGKV